MKTEQAIENPELSQFKTETSFAVRTDSKEFVFFMDAVKNTLPVDKSLCGKDLFVTNVKIYLNSNSDHNVAEITITNAPVNYKPKA